MRQYCGLCAFLRLFFGDPSRDEELGLSSGVPGCVVVDTGPGLDLHGGPRHRTIPEVDHGHCDFGPLHVLLQHRGVAVGEGRDHRRRELLCGAHQSGAQRRPTPRRFDHQRQSQAFHDRRHDGRSTQIPKDPVRQRVATWSTYAPFGDDALGDGLVEGQSAGHRTTAHVGDAHCVEHVGQGAVLPGSAVHQRDDHRRRIRLQGGQ